MGRFSNPADKLSNIAAEPKSMLGDEMTILELNRQCKQHLAEYQRLNEHAQLEMKLIIDKNHQGSSEHDSTRRVPLCKQYKLLLMRHYTVAFRVPIAFAALICMALI